MIFQLEGLGASDVPFGPGLDAWGVEDPLVYTDVPIPAPPADPNAGKILGVSTKTLLIAAGVFFALMLFTGKSRRGRGRVIRKRAYARLPKRRRRYRNPRSGSERLGRRTKVGQVARSTRRTQSARYRQTSPNYVMRKYHD